MRKKMIAMLFVLILTLSGCADVSTAPEESDNYELVTETEAAAETESTESSSFSESKESESAKTDTELESYVWKQRTNLSQYRKPFSR